MLYVFTEPLAAVTVTISSLLPSAKPDRPEIETVAAASSAVAATLTAVVFFARTTVCPFTTAEPLTVRTLRLLLEESGKTLTFTV